MTPEEKDLALQQLGAVMTKVNRLPDDLAERVSELTKRVTTLEVGLATLEVGLAALTTKFNLFKE
jgi:hypothetical protein